MAPLSSVLVVSSSQLLFHMFFFIFILENCIFFSLGLMVFWASLVFVSVFCTLRSCLFCFFTSFLVNRPKVWAFVGRSCGLFVGCGKLGSLNQGEIS